MSVKPKSQLCCRQIMHTFVATVPEDETVFRAARTMRDHDVGFLPVTNREGVVVGVLTDRDIALRITAEDRPPTSTVVGEVMTKEVVSCRSDEAMTIALRRMRQHRLTRIVVLDERGTAIGVVSLSDLAQYAETAQVGRTLRSITERKYAPERP